MTRRPRSATRPAPVFRASDGAPWPTDDELDLDAEWAALRESADIDWWVDDEGSQTRDSPDHRGGEPRDVIAPASVLDDADGLSDGRPDVRADGRWDGWPGPRPDGWTGSESVDWRDGGSGAPGTEAAASDLDARLGHLELVVAERHRATAEEYRLIAEILADAIADPTPWVGPDPTLDRAWHDRRGRTAAAVRRDRLDMAQRAAVAEIALRLRVSEQTVRARATRAQTLKERCPRLWRTFTDGRTSERHAIETARLADSLPAAPFVTASPAGGDGPENGVDATPASEDPSAVDPSAEGDAAAASADASPVDAGASDARADAEATAPSADESAAVWHAFDTAVTDRAVRLVPAKFAVAARAIREKVHAESVDERHRRAAVDRGVWMTPELDGMASLSALLPAADARGVMAQLDRAARHLRAAADEERTLAQLRADVLADLVVRPAGDAAPPPSDDGPTDARRVWTTRHEHYPPPRDTHDGENLLPWATPAARDRRPHHSMPIPPTADTDDRNAPLSRDTPPVLHRRSRPPDGSSPVLGTTPSSPRPHENALAARHPAPSPVQATVILTVPALTLLGAGREPATLEGYGPIDLDTARRLAGGATSWVRLLTDPVTAVPLALDRKTYRVPVALRRWLGITSPTCAFPGCARSATDCDIDHRRHGATAARPTPTTSTPNAVTITGSATTRGGHRRRRCRATRRGPHPSGRGTTPTRPRSDTPLAPPRARATPRDANPRGPSPQRNPARTAPCDANTRATPPPPARGLIRHPPRAKSPTARIAAPTAPSLRPQHPHPRDLVLQPARATEHPHLMRLGEHPGQLLTVGRAETETLPEPAGASAEEPGRARARLGRAVQGELGQRTPSSALSSLR